VAFLKILPNIPSPMERGRVRLIKTGFSEMPYVQIYHFTLYLPHKKLI
jgi:hypothetical protein